MCSSPCSGDERAWGAARQGGETLRREQSSGWQTRGSISGRMGVSDLLTDRRMDLGGGGACVRRLSFWSAWSVMADACALRATALLRCSAVRVGDGAVCARVRPCAVGRCRLVDRLRAGLGHARHTRQRERRHNGQNATGDTERKRNGAKFRQARHEGAPGPRERLAAGVHRHRGRAGVRTRQQTRVTRAPGRSGREACGLRKTHRKRRTHGDPRGAGAGRARAVFGSFFEKNELSLSHHWGPVPSRTSLRTGCKPHGNGQGWQGA